jgi:hypothetical protein
MIIMQTPSSKGQTGKAKADPAFAFFFLANRKVIRLPIFISKSHHDRMGYIHSRII